MLVIKFFLFLFVKIWSSVYVVHGINNLSQTKQTINNITAFFFLSILIAAGATKKTAQSS